MTESEFNQLSDAAFRRLEAALEAVDGEADFELAAGNVLEIDCPQGKIIVNRQPSMQEIWVAARSGGFHYRFAEGVWRDTRDGSELFASLAKMVAAQGGGTLELAD